jgi:hypothetical protein
MHRRKLHKAMTFLLYFAIQLIQAGHIFPKGKQCVLNKYSIKPVVPRPEEESKKIGILQFI